MKWFFGDRQGESENGIIPDSVMVSRTIRTVVVLVICLAAMSFTAYAYFHHNVTSGSNVIHSAEYTIGVTVKQGGTVLSSESDNVYTLGADLYTVELVADGSATNGFCIVYVRFGDKTTKYHTQQLVMSGNENTMTFGLDLREVQNVTEFEAEFVGHWGTSSVYGYGNQDSNPLYIRDGLTANVATGMTVQTDFDDENDPEQDQVQEGDKETDYIVVSGDTLTIIAQRFGVTVDALVERNAIADRDFIMVGQRLIIPAADEMRDQP